VHRLLDLNDLLANYLMGCLSDSYKVGVRKLQIIGVRPWSKNKNETIFEEEVISESFRKRQHPGGILDHGSRECWTIQNSSVNGGGNSRQCGVIAGHIGKDAQFRSICNLILALKEGTEKLFKDLLLALRVSFEDSAVILQAEIAALTRLKTKINTIDRMVLTAWSELSSQDPFPSTLVNHSLVKRGELDLGSLPPEGSRKVRKYSLFSFNTTEFTWNSWLKTLKYRSGFVPGDLKMMGLLLSVFCFLAGGAILIACDLAVERFRFAGNYGLHNVIVPRWKVDCGGMSLLLKGGRREDEVDCAESNLSRQVEAFSDTS